MNAIMTASPKNSTRLWTSPSVAPEPSELTLTINNRGCSTAYILATLQQHSWDV